MTYQRRQPGPFDSNYPHWQQPHYLRVDGLRPYLSILMPQLRQYPHPDETLHSFVDSLYAYATQKYSEWPYIVGVTRDVPDIWSWAGAGVDAITQYCQLAYAGKPVQQYPKLIDERWREWFRIQSSSTRAGTPFIPSPAVGWDASPRGEPGYKLEEVEGIHPYTPIVIHNTPGEVARMLARAMYFTAISGVPEGQQLITVFAWNEVSEGATLLPRLRPDGAVDKSYLEAIKSIISKGPEKIRDIATSGTGMHPPITPRQFGQQGF